MKDLLAVLYARQVGWGWLRIFYRAIFPKERTIYIVNNNEAYVDLWMMSQCKHFIIANSTFSWWGAWLSTNKNKYILCPNLHLTSGISGWGFKGLIPADWFGIDF